MDIFECLQQISVLSSTAPDKLQQLADDLMRRMTEPHRYWHTLHHLEDLWTRIPKDVSGELFDKVRLAILFHDAIYLPDSSTNEEESARLFLKSVELEQPFVEEVALAIEGTKTGQGTGPTAEILNALDRSILNETSTAKLMAWEKAIAKEYQYVSWPDYRKGRCEFLRQQNIETLNRLAEYVEAYRPTIGIYAGSFNPFHLGHFDILAKAEKLFDKVVVAVGTNPTKADESPENRTMQIKSCIPYREVRPFSNLLIELVQEIRTYANPVVVRGLRDGFDLQFELNQARFHEDLLPGIEIVYLPCGREFQHISSSAIRALQQFSSETAQNKARDYLPKSFC